MIRFFLTFLLSNKTEEYRVKAASVIGGLVLVINALPVSAQVHLSGAIEVAVGNSHSCAVMSAGAVKCWGRGAEGQLGNGSHSNRLMAVDVSGLSNAVSVVTGNSHTCALTSEGGVKCWGNNQYSGALGNNSYDNSAVPVDVAGLQTGVAALAAGGNFNCALTNTGAVKCWGSGAGGALGNGATATSPIPVDVVGLSSGIIAISAGENHACALTNQGAVKCWGSASNGKLGNGNAWPSFVTAPVDVIGLSSGVVKIDAGISHTCAALATGIIKCWGDNTYGQLGDTTTTSQFVPVTASVVDSSFTALSLTSRASCIVTDTARVKCWGGSASDAGNAPMEVDGFQAGVEFLDTRNSHSCAALANGGSVVCWGSGFSGTLGNNRTNDSSIPVNVIQAVVPAAPISVVATPYNSFAIVSFTPPINLENEAITRYTVISEPWAPLEDVTGIMATTRQIRGLTNGVNYTFRVVATNIAGQGQPSEPSIPIVPMSHYVPLPTGCSLTGELIEGITFSSDLGHDDCPSSTQTPSFMREFFSFNAVPGDQVAFNIQAGYALNASVYNPYRMPVRNGGVFYGRYPSEGYITIPAGLSGAYSIEVSNSALYTPTGPYTITLLKNSSAANSSAQASSSSFFLSSSHSSSSHSSSSHSSISSLVSSSLTSSAAISSAATSSLVSSQNSSNSVGANASSAGSSVNFSAESSVAFSASSAVMSSAQISSLVSSTSSSVAANGCGSPLPVMFGTSYTGHLASGDCTNGLRGGNYYTDRYSFTATPGQQITILLSSTAIDSYLYLKSPSNTLVASDDDSGGGRNSRIPASGTFTIPAGVTGTYVVEVTSYSTLQTGAYTLLITGTTSNTSSSFAASSFATSTASSSTANVCNTSIASVLNVTNDGMLATTDCNTGARGAGYYADRYTFAATAGQLVAISLNSSAFDTYLYLKNSSGNIIASNDDGGGGTNSRIPASSGSYAIPATGTYVIEVTSYSSNRTGAYTLLRSQQ